MKKISNTLLYIKERFPIEILTFTTISTVLASESIATNVIIYWKVIAAFVITTLFLFHIRVIDERRDFVNDLELHPDRPVQRGLVSIKTLLIISIAGILFSLILSFCISMPTFLIALFFVVYTSIAAFDFFRPAFFKNKPILYHIVNSPQMILIQWLIFSIFTYHFAMSKEMYLLILLIYNNIFMLEIVRKINPPEQDTKDSYTAMLGLKKSVLLVICLVLTGFTFYTLIISEIGVRQFVLSFCGALLSLCVIGVCSLFYFKPSNSTKKIIEYSALLFYIILNLLIFIAK